MNAEELSQNMKNMKISTAMILALVTVATHGDEVLYQTSFEAPAFNPALPVRGQDNWEMLNDGDGLSISASNARTGSQALRMAGALLGQTGPDRVETHAFWTGLWNAPRPAPIIEMSVYIRLDGPQTGTNQSPSDDLISANFSAYSESGGRPVRLASIMASSAGRFFTVGSKPDDAYRYSAPLVFGAYHKVAMRLDFVARTVRYFVDDLDLGTAGFDPSIEADRLLSPALYLIGPMEPRSSPYHYDPADYIASWDDYQLTSIDLSPVNAVIEFATTNILADEFVPTVKLNVIRRGFTNAAVRVSVATTNLTAIAGEDYGAISTFITLAAGETNKEVEIPIHEDYWPESDETFVARLSDLPPGATSGKGSVRITVRDDERPGSIDAGWSTTFGLPPLKAGERKLAYPIVYPIPLQADGKPIVTFQLDTYIDGLPQPQFFRVIRLNPDGSIDPAFRAYQSTRQFFATPLLNGEIIVAEDNYPRGMRLSIRNSDGSAKSTLTSITNVSVAAKASPDGKVILFGSSISVLGQPPRNILRLNSDYSLDTNFTAPASASGTVLWHAFALHDGKIFLGPEMRLTAPSAVNGARLLNNDGSVDTNFNVRFTGPTPPSIGAAILQADGKLIVAGSFQTVNGQRRNSIVRLNSDGSTDDTFKTGVGFTVRDFSGARVAANVAVDPLPDGAMLASGEFDQFDGHPVRGPVLLRPDGSRDPSFEGSTVPHSEYLGSSSVYVVGVIGGQPVYFCDYGLGRLRTHLPLRIVEHSQGGQSILANALAGRAYTLQSSENLASWTDLTTQTATTNRIDFTVGTPSSPNGFYRIKQN